MESESTQNSWDEAITLLFRPRLLLQGVVEYLMAWSFTRCRWRLLLIYSLPLILLLASVGLVGYGLSLSNRTLAERYDQWVAEEIPDAIRELESADQSASRPEPGQSSGTPRDSGSTTASSGSPENDPQVKNDKNQAPVDRLVSPFGDLLLRRLLQLQDSSSRITYLVAAQLARQERLGQARQLMRRIAPEESAGFAPAHTWLAFEQLRSMQQRVANPEERNRMTQQVIKDLETAVTWSNCPESLRILYAEWLEGQAGNTAQAMAVLEQANAQQSSMAANLKIAEMALKHDQAGRFRRAAEEIKLAVKARREDESLSTDDLMILANLLLLEQNSQSAREAAQEGLSRSPNDPRFLRLISEAYRIEYLTSITNKGGQTSVNLSLLDAALKTDPTNPGVGQEIARLLSVGQDTSPELKAALEKQLSQGQATALTHILLANRCLLNNDLAAAEPHLEVALRQAPNSPTTLNNLALVLARTKPNEIKRALELSTTACQLAPTNATFRDSLGEIRALAGDKLGAIECFEAAIGLEPKLINTRQRLEQLYRQLGMTDMAIVQQRELERLLQPPTEQQTPDQTPPSISPETPATSSETPATSPETPASLPETPATSPKTPTEPR